MSALLDLLQNLRQARIQEDVARVLGGTPAEGMRDVNVERIRQVREEEFTPTKDLEVHGGGPTSTLLTTALLYAAHDSGYELANSEKTFGNRAKVLWPWCAHTDKRHEHDRRRRLVIAAALIIAEIDRLDAVKAKQEAEQPRLEPFQIASARTIVTSCRDLVQRGLWDRVVKEMTEEAVAHFAKNPELQFNISIARALRLGIAVMDQKGYCTEPFFVQEPGKDGE